MRHGLVLLSALFAISSALSASQAGRKRAAGPPDDDDPTRCEENPNQCSHTVRPPPMRPPSLAALATQRSEQIQAYASEVAAAAAAQPSVINAPEDAGDCAANPESEECNPWAARVTFNPVQSASSASAAIALSTYVAGVRNAAAVLDNEGIGGGTYSPNLTDPCGPPNHSLQLSAGAPGSNSTCHGNVSIADTTQQTYYGVNCFNNSAAPLLSDCDEAMQSMCEQISGESGSGYQATNQWFYGTAQDGVCTYGYWLPEGGAPPPSFDRCVNNIAQPMFDACDADFNVGSVNIKVMPSYNSSTSTSTTGEAVDPYYPSYIMVPQAGYCGVNGPIDGC